MYGVIKHKVIKKDKKLVPIASQIVVARLKHAYVGLWLK